MFWKKKEKLEQENDEALSIRGHKMNEDEIHMQAMFQKIINGNDKSIPKFMIMKVPGFPLPFDIRDQVSEGHPDAVENGKAFSDILRTEILSWLNNEDENMPKWFEFNVKVSPVELMLFNWLYYQCQIRENGELEKTSSKIVMAVESDDMSEFVSGFVRAAIVDLYMHHTTQLSEGTHFLTRYRKSQKRQK